MNIVNKWEFILMLYTITLGANSMLFALYVEILFRFGRPRWIWAYGPRVAAVALFSATIVTTITAVALLNFFIIK